MNQEFNRLYLTDMERYKTQRGGVKRFFIRDYIKTFHYYFRKCQTSKNPILKNYYRFRYAYHCKKRHLEIPSKVNIGAGLYLGHAYCITINEKALLGENCNIHKGVTIGQENRGARKGTPVIGNKVWIGINATVVGNVKIGNDVLIAPNSFVNCDVPDHSVVFGNPCIIKHRENATENYINRIQGN